MTTAFTTKEKIAETSSKGNQEKWKDGRCWHKLDQFGYEALAETVISQLLEYSSIETDTPSLSSGMTWSTSMFMAGSALPAGAKISWQRDSPSSP